ncbi:SH3 domain-containing protein [uncultured Ruminococcus sp.]|uniref:SH3 domain-containing protein n=1 Tax=uncultured Ruminococcus sp. TaxID=165186 RepID=UPI0025DF5A18|nr:SH3 domain-containing protein [uncultured Ruminococcus sp.]
MPENNQYRHDQSRHHEGQRRRPPQQDGQRRPVRQQDARRAQPNRQGARKSRKQQEREAAMASTVKGIIAIMLTFLIVIVVIMLFWKNLFTANETGPKATGTITSTKYDPPETKTVTEREETEKSTKKKVTKAEEEDDEDENTQMIKCVGAVLLHPEPSSSSTTIDTIPAGVDVKFIRNENNWYYVEYNGKEGYAWGNFFTAPVEN